MAFLSIKGDGPGIWIGTGSDFFNCTNVGFWNAPSDG